MTAPKLSVVLPGIRPHNWEALYNSIDCSCSFELVVVSPYDLPDPLKNKGIVHIVDWGSPMRASCIGANACTGHYFTWAADDGAFVSGALDKTIAMLDSDAHNDKYVIAAKYLEACSEVHPDSYYVLNNAYPRSPYISDSWWIFNCAVMHRSYYNRLGGWDCIFETNALGHADLAVRAQRDGAKVDLFREAFINVGHMPGTSGDHGPICITHHQHDDPLYSAIYHDPACVNRIVVDRENWRLAEPRWSRRF